MTRQEFIDAIRNVDTKAADLMDGYLDNPGDIDIDPEFIKARRKASMVLLGIMTWRNAPEGHAYWAKVGDKLDKYENGANPKFHNL
jgi:hypothetical protein